MANNQEENAVLIKLRRIFPWPREIPKVAPRDHGWFSGEKVLPRWCNSQVKIVVELGSWLGKSARYFLKKCPHATVICVDHWKGSEEHRRDPQWVDLLPRLYDTFLVNMWEYRDRVIPVRSSTCDALAYFAAEGLKPDLVYIDAAHDTSSVFADTMAAMTAFPGAQIFGDDWLFPPVAKGVVQAATALNFRHRLRHQGRIWWFDRRGDYGGQLAQGVKRAAERDDSRELVYASI